MHAARAIVLGAAILAVAAAGAVRGQSSDLAVKDRANAFSSIAASGQFVAVVWGATTKDAVTDVYVAASRNGGRAFGPPVRVNRVDGQAKFSGQ